MPTTKPPYPAEFRQQIIELVSVGRSPAELAREFGCSAQTIANWVAQSAMKRTLAMAMNTASETESGDASKNFSFVKAIL